MKRGLALIVILAGYLAGLLALPRLPAAVSPDLSELVPFVTAADSRPASKIFTALAFPTVALALWLLMVQLSAPRAFAAIRRRFPGRASEPSQPDEAARHEATIEDVALGAVIVILAMHGAGLASALGAPPSVYHIVPLVFGLLLIVGGNAVPGSAPT